MIEFKGTRYSIVKAEGRVTIWKGGKKVKGLLKQVLLLHGKDVY